MGASLGALSSRVVYDLLMPRNDNRKRKDTKVRVDGDFAVWVTPGGKEYRRWASGNTQGKHPGTLKDRHPKSAEPIATGEQGRALGQKGNEIKAERWRSAAQAGMIEELEKSGKIAQGSGPADAFGAIVGVQSGMATDPELERAATGAARFVAESIGAMTRGGGQVQAVQINVQIGEGVKAKYLDDEEDDVVDANFTEAAQDDE